jgi:hypothetical protein
VSSGTTSRSSVQIGLGSSRIRAKALDHCFGLLVNKMGCFGSSFFGAWLARVHHWFGFVVGAEVHCVLRSAGEAAMSLQRQRTRM